MSKSDDEYIKNEQLLEPHLEEDQEKLYLETGFHIKIKSFNNIISILGYLIYILKRKRITFDIFVKKYIEYGIEEYDKIYKSHIYYHKSHIIITVINNNNNK